MRKLPGAAIDLWRKRITATHCAMNCVIVCTTMRTEMRSASEKRHATADSTPITRSDVDGNLPVGWRRAKGLKKRPSAAAVYGTRENPRRIAKTEPQLAIRINTETNTPLHRP